MQSFGFSEKISLNSKCYPVSGADLSVKTAFKYFGLTFTVADPGFSRRGSLLLDNMFAEIERNWIERGP